jgi:hypothetical protein
MLNLSTFWKKKKRYQIILKGGASFIIRADDMHIKWQTSDLTVVSYEFEGIEGALPFHIVANEIAAIIRL